MPKARAEILAQGQTRLVDETLATRRDLKELELRLKREIHAMTIKFGGITGRCRWPDRHVAKASIHSDIARGVDKKRL